MRTRIPHALACAIVLCLAAVGTVSAADTISASNTATIIINDNASATVYGSEIAVKALRGRIENVTVTLHDVWHAFPDDIDVLLVAPGGQKILLMSDAGAGVDLKGANLSFSGTATSQLPDATGISSGTYLPTDYASDADNTSLPLPAPTWPYSTDMTVLNGPASSQNGSWRLYVLDDYRRDAGKIVGGWTLAITSAGFDSCAAEQYEGSQYALCRQICEADRTRGQGLNGLLNAWTKQFGGTPPCTE